MEVNTLCASLFQTRHVTVRFIRAISTLLQHPQRSGSVADTVTRTLEVGVLTRWRFTSTFFFFLSSLIIHKATIVARGAQSAKRPAIEKLLCWQWLLVSLGQLLVHASQQRSRGSIRAACPPHNIQAPNWQFISSIRLLNAMLLHTYYATDA